MKSQLNKYRKYTVSDFLLNINIFKEYLQFCQKNNLKKEKKYIMENLFRTLKEKGSSQKPSPGLIKLCILLIIFSDFEIELLFDLEYCNPQTPKMILSEIQNYLNSNNSDEEIKKYINYKNNYWTLKLQNQNFISLNEVKDTILTEKEVKESIEKLTEYINIDNSIYKQKKENEKLFILKIIYELALYYYYKNEDENAYNYLETLINYYNEYIEEYKIDVNSKKKKLFYFDIERVKSLYDYIKKNKESYNEMQCEFNNDSNEEFFILNDVSNYENIINEDYNKYKNEIVKTNNDYQEKLILNNDNLLNSCELSNKNCVNSLLNCLKTTEFLIDITLDNFNNYEIGKNFINTLKNKVDFKINNNTNKKEDNDLQYIKKEITYYDYMFELIENMINNSDKLHMKFFKSLSEFIINNTLTGNLKLSGLLHSTMINFSDNLKTLKSYFTDFSRFFNDKTLVYKEETINQITFITKIVQIFYTINDAKNKINFPLDKEITINISQEIHVELINIFLYWLNCDDSQNEDSKKKDLKKSKKNLKFNPSRNIIYILIESLNNLDFLKMLKIIISNVLEFVINKKHLIDNGYNSELMDIIYDIKFKLFKINNFLDGVLRNIKVIVDDSTYYINFKINFNESTNRDKYIFKNDILNFYIKTLFHLVRKVDSKINKYESIQKINKIRTNNNNNNIIIDNDNNDNNIIMNIDNNIIISNDNNNEIKNKDNDFFDELYIYKKNRFLLSFYYIIEINSKTADKDIKSTIINGINFLQLSMSNFKIAYMKNDLMNDITKIQKNYDTFKSLLNQDILYQIILCFIKQNRFLDALILIQYTKKLETTVVYKLLQNVRDKNDFINIDNFKYIWKMIIFEYLSNFFYRNYNFDALNKIKSLIKRVSNHQFFKGHAFRKNFKIVNFFNFLDYLNNIKYNF